MKSVYVLSPKSVVEYYSIIGVNIKKLNKYDTSSSIELRDLEELDNMVPYNLMKDLPDSSMEIAAEMKYFLHNACTNFGHNEEEMQLKACYIDYVHRILLSATLLNLIPINNFNYKLHFERLNSVILEVLKSINSMEVYEFLDFIKLFGNDKTKNDKNYFYWLRKYPVLVLLLSLAKTDDLDKMDYKIFESPTSSKISYTNLVDIMKERLASVNMGSLPS